MVLQTEKPFCTPDLCDQAGDNVEVMAPIFTNYGGHKSFGGRILTIKCFEDNSLIKTLASQPGEGRVMVVDGGGSLRKALLGDMIAEQAVANNWAGLIIFGCIRDVDIISTLPLGVKALNVIPVKTERRGAGAQGIPIDIAGVKVSTGQYVYADNDGILVSNVALC